MKSKVKVGDMFDSYKLDKLVGSGGYGQVYLAHEIGSNRSFAVKVETASDAKIASLKKETANLLAIQKSHYFPKVFTSGKQNSIRFIVMELLGCSVATMRAQCDEKHYSTYTSLKIAYEMLKCIQALHNIGYIHRDIKPANFLIRASKKYPLCLVDFGLVRPYRDPKTNEIVPMKKGLTFIGTRKYGSLNAHEGYTLSRRDDMISWFYSVVELFDGALPWSDSKDNNTLYLLKRDAKSADLCSHLPAQFVEIYRRLRVLKYEEEPPYDYILSLIQSAIETFCQPPYQFDWELFSDERIKRISAINLNAISSNTDSSSSESFISSDDEDQSISDDSSVSSDSDSDDMSYKDDICMNQKIWLIVTLSLIFAGISLLFYKLVNYIS